MRTHNLMLLVTASLMVAAPAAAQRWTWNGRVGTGQAFEVKGVNGSVRAVAGTGSEIEVVATKSARRSDPDEVKFEVVEHRNGITICAVYPSKPGRRPNDCQPGEGGHSSVENNDVQVDFEIRLPRGTDFVGRTVNGRVTATGLGGDVRAYTVNGDVRVTTAGTAEASTVNGSIDVTMGRANWNDLLEFETVNGSIIVELPTSVDTEVHASTVNGSIDADFPLTVRGKFGPKRVTGTIGRGGRELSLSTVNGSIEIRKGN